MMPANNTPADPRPIPRMRTLPNAKPATATAAIVKMAVATADITERSIEWMDDASRTIVTIDCDAAREGPREGFDSAINKPRRLIRPLSPSQLAASATRNGGQLRETPRLTIVKTNMALPDGFCSEEASASLRCARLVGLRSAFVPPA